MPEVASLVVFARDAQATVAFYRAIGINLEDESHEDDGVLHFAAELGAVHVAVYQAETGTDPAPPFRDAGSTFAGFYVDALDDTRAAVLTTGARLITDHQQRPWGCRIVAEDPDGRAVEINQRNHC